MNSPVQTCGFCRQRRNLWYGPPPLNDCAVTPLLADFTPTRYQHNLTMYEYSWLTNNKNQY